MTGEMPPAGDGPEEIDEDIALAKAYCAGDLDEETCDAIDSRILDDEAFRAKVEPLIDAWAETILGPEIYEPGVPTPEMIARSRERMLRALFPMPAQPDAPRKGQDPVH